MIISFIKNFAIRLERQTERVTERILEIHFSTENSTSHFSFRVQLFPLPFRAWQTRRFLVRFLSRSRFLKSYFDAAISR